MDTQLVTDYINEFINEYKSYLNIKHNIIIENKKEIMEKDGFVKLSNNLFDKKIEANVKPKIKNNFYKNQIKESKEKSNKIL